MGKMYNVLAHVFCQQKITLFLLVNSVLFVPLGNLFCKSFKIFDLSLRSWLYFCLVDCVLTVTVLVHLGVGDDCLQHEFGIPEKIEGGCVGCFPPPWLVIQSQSKWWWQIWVSFIFSRDLQLFGIASIHFLQSSGIFKKWCTDCCRKVWCTILVSLAIKHRLLRHGKSTW